jgi:hypothetical protein
VIELCAQDVLIPGTHLQGSETDLNMVIKSPCPCWELNLSYQACNLITILSISPGPIPYKHWI